MKVPLLFFQKTIAAISYTKQDWLCTKHSYLGKRFLFITIAAYNYQTRQIARIAEAKVLPSFGMQAILLLLFLD